MSLLRIINKTKPKMFLYKVSENTNFEKVWSIFSKIKWKKFKFFFGLFVS